MRIVYCIAGTFHAGGMERVLSNKANYFARLGYEVYIITTDQQGRKPYFSINPEIQQIDLEINYAANSTKKLISKIYNYAKLQYKHKRLLKAVLQELKADIVISMFDHEVSFLHRLQDGSKKILEIHFSRFKRMQYARVGIWKWINLYRSRLDYQWVKAYDRFVVLTAEDYKYWGNLSNMQVIPNANSFESAALPDPRSKRVIAVGRYDYQKGFDDLIHAWNIVRRKYPTWTLTIYGDGVLRNDYLHLINRLGLGDCIQLENAVLTIQKEYLNSAILAMTSRYEGLPMVLLEGQATGLPLVSYDCKCGPKDIIVSGENGFLVAMGDITSFANRLIQLMDDPQLRLQMGACAKKMSARFSESAVMQQWEQLFKNIVR